MTRVLVNEDYSYGLWVWEHPGTIEEVVHDWEEGSAPLDFTDGGPRQGFKGTVVPVETTDCGIPRLMPRSEFDAVAYVGQMLGQKPEDYQHEGDYLVVGEGLSVRRYYPGSGPPS